ncbi:hypothetical protein VN97_g5448, partial [Penicillium thymicola]
MHKWYISYNNGG